MNSNSRNIILHHLGNGAFISPGYGMGLAEAGAVCLENQGHENDVKLKVNGTFNDTYNLYWPAVTEQMKGTWKDLEFATEQGAYGIAFLLLIDLTGLTVIERSIKGTGFDYWLGDQETFPFQNKTRLEVSGILKGNNNRIQSRLHIKLNQTRRSDGLLLPVYVVIVEFSNPQSEIAKR